MDAEYNERIVDDMNKKIEISNQVTKLSYALIIVIVLCSVLFIYMFSTINSLKENLIKLEHKVNSLETN